jgi:hypothetical protein
MTMVSWLVPPVVVPVFLVVVIVAYGLYRAYA